MVIFPIKGIIRPCTHVATATQVASATGLSAMHGKEEPHTQSCVCNRLQLSQSRLQLDSCNRGPAIAVALHLQRTSRRCLFPFVHFQFFNMNDQRFNLKLISEVEKREILYNYRLSEYHRRDFTDKAWQDVAFALNSSGEQMFTYLSVTTYSWELLLYGFVQGILMLK